MNKRSKLLRLYVRNIGCIGEEGVEVFLDKVVCLVGRNNSGKSTILKAYELARGTERFMRTRDRCAWATESSPSEVHLDIHIPEGVANIGEEWKFEKDGNLVLRSRWQWLPESKFEKVERSTWDPQSSTWASDGKAGGADNVFNSRLPRPLRVGSLQDVDKTEGVLLALALDPFVTELTRYQTDPSSTLAQTVVSLVQQVSALGKSHEERFNLIAGKIQGAFSGVFPGLDLRLDIAMEPPPIKIAELLKTGSAVRIVDGKSETGIAQQGTGARRTLFWSMLRVHNELKQASESIEAYKKELTKKIRAARGDTKADLEQKLALIEAGAPLQEDTDDPALPGYILLIDEPENALHPMASRAAQRHLYELASDPNWQVMMTTHSPFFINPLADHTTIIRMERTKGDTSPLFTRLYRSERVNFSDEEKEQLRGIQTLDASFAEVFFGSYPILVEGDTEHAAFLAAVTERDHALKDQVTIIRARGKAIIPAIIRMLRHFQVDFGVVHDIDWPYHSNGKNGMWLINAKIHAEVSLCREKNIRVRHRHSIPDFERFLGGVELGKDKPIEAYRRVKSDKILQKRMQDLIDELHVGQYDGLHSDKAYEEPEHLKELLDQLNVWARENDLADDKRLKPQ